MLVGINKCIIYHNKFSRDTMKCMFTLGKHYCVQGERERDIASNNSRKKTNFPRMPLLLFTIKVHKKVILAFKHPLLLVLRAVK